MSSIPDPELLNSKRTQLTFLQNRVSTYARKLWQLPLTFLGLLAIVASGALNGKLGPHPQLVFGAVAVVGVGLIWCMCGVREGYTRGCGHMARLEEELGLVPTTAAKSLHVNPYFGLLVVGTCFALSGVVFCG